MTAGKPEGDVRTVESNGLRLAYEVFGDESATPVLLVMGLGSQMIVWETDFCRMLADRGHFVIRYDNRDIGLSTHLDELPAGRPVAAFFGREHPAYRMDDLADDAAGLMTGIGLDSAHIVGISMGGCISQALVVRHPDRVRSLTSISSSTGSRRVGHPRLGVAARMLTRGVAADREQAITLSLAWYRQVASPAYPARVERIRELAGEAYDRRYDPAGAARQFAAILGSPDRTAALRSVQVPTLVMHGEADPLIGVSGGRATAAAIPGARLITYPGVGHEIHPQLWDDYVGHISEIVSAGEELRART